MKLKKGRRDYKVQSIGILDSMAVGLSMLCQVDAIGMARLVKDNPSAKGMPTHALLMPQSSDRMFFTIRVFPTPDRDLTMRICYYPPMKVL